MRTLAASLALVLLPAALQAQGWIEPRTGVAPRAGVVKVRTDVSVQVTDRVARVEVEEWFRNDGHGVGEGDYLYPLPGEAVFTDFSLFQGDQELRGETMDAARARAVYEEIVRSRRDPALIELAGHGLLRARVFPIEPGETRRIVLRYSQVLTRAGDALHFRYLAGGRYAGAGPRRLAGPVLPPVEEPGVRPLREAPPLSFRLTAEDGALFGEPFSPTHAVRVSRERGRLTVRPAAALDGDFSLFLPLARGRVGMTLATHAAPGEAGYFMLTLSPGEVRGEAVPRDVAVVLDVSGSMAGGKIEQARQALHQLLGSLSTADRFRLVAFSSTVQPYRPGWTVAGAAEIRAARRWVDALEARGGTNIEGALAEAFRERGGGAGRLPIVVFLTDGLPTVGETNPERLARLAERDRGDARVFAFGVGYDVNTYLLDRLGAAGRGGTQYVGPDEDVETALATLATRIRHPVLTDLRIADAPARLHEVYPMSLPDLFAGEELIVFGRYDAARTGRGSLTVVGTRAGREERFTVEAAFAPAGAAAGFIPRLWAARKIGWLTQQLRLNGANPEIEQEVRETALRYGLLSEYTAHLVQEPPGIGALERDGVRLHAVVPTGVAAAPAAAHGREAVRAAERSRVRREARTQADLAAAEKFAVGEMVATGSGVRVVAGRGFILSDGTWTDRGHSAALRVVQIEPFSRAYFELLRALPELQPVWAELERSLVAGRRASIRVAPGGEKALSAARLAELVRDFRGL